MGKGKSGKRAPNVGTSHFLGTNWKARELHIGNLEVPGGIKSSFVHCCCTSVGDLLQKAKPKLLTLLKTL